MTPERADRMARDLATNAVRDWFMNGKDVQTIEPRQSAKELWTDTYERWLRNFGISANKEGN